MVPVISCINSLVLWREFSVDHTFSIETNMISIVFKEDFLNSQLCLLRRFFPSQSALSLFSVICKTRRLITCTDYFNSSSSSSDGAAWQDAIHYRFHSIVNAWGANLMHDFLFTAQLQCHRGGTLPKIKHCTITWKESDGQWVCNKHLWVLHQCMVEGKPLVA